MAGRRLGPAAVAARLARDEERRRIARELRGRARRIAERQAVKNVQFWIRVRDDVDAALGHRLTAAAELENRCGAPTRTRGDLELTDAAPKLFAFVQPTSSDERFQPPAARTGRPALEPHTNGHEQEGV